VKILHVTLTNSGGGASAIARALNQSINQLGFNSSLICLEGEDLANNILFLKNRREKLIFRLKNKFSKAILFFFTSNKHDFRSLNLFNSNLLKFINESDFEIIHFHWIGSEIISVEDIAKINKKIVWTLHDSWPLNGTYHINHFEVSKSIIFNYFNDYFEKFFLKRKSKLLSNLRINFVAPSNYLVGLYENSFYDKSFSKCHLIPNFFTNDNLKIINKAFARESLKIINNNKQIIVLGGFNIFTVYNKGVKYFNMLSEKLEKSKYKFLIFGTENNVQNPFSEFECLLFGKVNDSKILNLIYSAGDLCIVPSIFESFSLVTMESLQCGTPVVAFNNSGIKDLITHKTNGYLAEYDDIDDLINGIIWACSLDNYNFVPQLEKFQRNRIAESYINLYEGLCSS
jgi:glycosyltransferase involved in cell wall biosynthesis